MTPLQHDGSSVRRLTSTVDVDRTVRLELVDAPAPTPRDHEVVVMVEAAPVNPSDLIVMLAGADATTLRRSSDAHVLEAPLPHGAPDHAERLGLALPVGNEGAGRVVASGAAPEARALVGRTVAVLGGGTFADLVCVPWRSCLPFPDTTPAAAVAGAFVNPMTVLAMLHTMRTEGHTALVHTAAASSLGRMLLRRCRREGVPLVNVCRRREQAELLREAGAEHVCVSGDADFEERLADAIASTGATLAFDAVGGATTGALLRAMELALRRTKRVNGPYGTNVRKQVYVYGYLDPADVRVPRDVGMAWSVGGWLLADQLRLVGDDVVAGWRQRVVDSVEEDFATTYGRRVVLEDLVEPAVLEAASRHTTGEKLLVVRELAGSGES